MMSWGLDWNLELLPPAAEETASIAVVDATGQLAGALGEVCRMLRLRLLVADDVTTLAGSLRDEAPIAVLCGHVAGEGRAVSRILRLIASYDRTLPVLLLTGEDPETLGSVDAATKLWPLANLQRIAGTLPVEKLLGFLAAAGRRTGGLRLMPV